MGQALLLHPQNDPGLEGIDLGPSQASILNYINDWLILAHLQEVVCTHSDVTLDHLAQLKLWVK